MTSPLARLRAIAGAVWDRVLDACDVDRIDLTKLTQDEPWTGDQ